MTILFSLTSILFSFLSLYSYSYEVKLVLIGMAGASFCVALSFLISSLIQKDTVTPVYPEKKDPT